MLQELASQLKTATGHDYQWKARRIKYVINIIAAI